MKERKCGNDGNAVMKSFVFLCAHNFVQVVKFARVHPSQKERKTKNEKNKNKNKIVEESKDACTRIYGPKQKYHFISLFNRKLYI